MSNSNNMGVQTATPASTTSTTIENHPQPVLRISAPAGTLRLRAEPAEQRHIQWADDVVDNEGMGKKSSKVCCIYHKPREVGESSDESSSDSSSDDDSDSEPDNGEARPTGARKGERRGRRSHNHGHDHEHDDDEHDHELNEGPSRQPQKRPRRRPSPNAYEKMPKQRK